MLFVNCYLDSEKYRSILIKTYQSKAFNTLTIKYTFYFTLLIGKMLRVLLKQSAQVHMGITVQFCEPVSCFQSFIYIYTH